MFQAVCLHQHYIHRTEFLINKMNNLDYVCHEYKLSIESYQQSKISSISIRTSNYQMQNSWDFHCMKDTRSNSDPQLFRSLKIIYNKFTKTKR